MVLTGNQIDGRQRSEHRAAADMRCRPSHGDLLVCIEFVLWNNLFSILDLGRH